MTTALARLEEQIVALHGRLNVRPTLVTAAQIGDLLVNAKREVQQGEFHKWVRNRLKISPRLAQTYIQIADAQSSSPLPENVSIDKFLRMMQARRVQVAEQLESGRGQQILGAVVRPRAVPPELPMTFREKQGTSPLADIGIDHIRADEPGVSVPTVTASRRAPGRFGTPFFRINRVHRCRWRNSQTIRLWLRLYPFASGDDTASA